MHLAESSSKGGKAKRRDRKRFVNERRVEPCPSQQPRKYKGGRSKKHKKDLSKIKCFRCKKLGHYTRSCGNGDAKVTCENFSNICVSSSIFLTESDAQWIIDSGATDHVAKDRRSYVEYRRILTGTKWIYLCNNTRAEVKGVGTCKLVLDNGRTLLLHDVLFTPDIHAGTSYRWLYLWGWATCGGSMILLWICILMTL